MSNVKHETLHASGAETADGNSGVHRAEGSDLAVGVAVTAVSGTSPTLDLEIQWSADGTNFGSAESADSFAQITAAANTAQRFAVKAPFYRLVWTITGTSPSFTFTAEAQVS